MPRCRFFVWTTLDSTMFDSFWAQEIDEYKTEPIYNEQQELHPLAQFRDVQDYARKAKVTLTGYTHTQLDRNLSS